nr:porin family protein [Phocaeicola vulgatus]
MNASFRIRRKFGFADYIQAFRRWDYGGIVGMKAVIADHYTISFDYRVGIKKIQAQNGLRNSTFQFSVGLSFLN